MRSQVVLNNNKFDGIYGTMDAHSLTRWTGIELDGETSEVFAIDVPANRVIQTLIKGNQQFVAKKNCPFQRQTNRSLSGIAQGRSPIAAIINSADTVDSIEEIFDQKFGDLFTLKNEGQLLSDKAISILEYSVLMLGVTVIVVLVNGHGTDSNHTPGGIRVFEQIDRLKSSPLLRKLTLTQELKIVSGYYDTETGHVSIIKK
jgi:carbonic anhydrase